MPDICVNFGYLTEASQEVGTKRFSEWKNPFDKVFEVTDRILEVDLYKTFTVESVMFKNAPIKYWKIKFELSEDISNQTHVKLSLKFKPKNAFYYFQTYGMLRWFSGLYIDALRTK
jgi:hypothetical protein